MWKADPDIWSRHAPILFPIVGRLKNDQYLYGGKKFSMKQHGLARDRKFALLSQTDTEASLRLVTDTQTLPIYPFEFELTVTYKLEDNKIMVSYLVKNPGDKALPFSIGGHPGFSCPILPTEAFTDYQIRFENKETIAVDLLEEGLISGNSSPILENEDTIPIHKGLFDRDALIFRGLTSNWVKLASTKSDHAVTLHFEGFPYLGIWAKPDAPFVCLEPWYGHADAATASGEFLEKEGIQVLEPKDTFTCAYTIEIS